MSRPGTAEGENRPTVVQVDLNSSTNITDALRGHTIGHAESFWTQFWLKPVVEKDVFVRGFLATLHKKNIEAAFKHEERSHPHFDHEFLLELGTYELHDGNGNEEVFTTRYVYSPIEVQSLRKTWRTSLALRYEGWFGRLISKYSHLWWSLRQLSMPHALLLVMAIFAAITQGMDQQSMAGANIHAPDALGVSLNDTFPKTSSVLLNSNQTRLTTNLWRFGAINGAPFLLGGIAGLLLLDPISEKWKWGRRGAVFMSGVFSLAAVVASAAVHQWGELLACRLILGIGMAGKASIVPILLSETSAKHMRGFLVMFWQLFVACGIAISALANIGVYHLNEVQSWRWMFIAAGFPALILIILAIFCQESPRWLLKRGDAKIPAAFNALVALHGLPSPIIACGELYLLHARLRYEQEQFETKAMRVQGMVRPTPMAAENGLPQSSSIRNGSITGNGSSHQRLASRSFNQNGIPLRDFDHRSGSYDADANSAASLTYSIADKTAENIPSIRAISTRKRWGLMRTPRMRRATYAAAAVMIAQQLCGINFLAFLSDTFVRNSLFPPGTAHDGENYKLLGFSVGYGLIQFFSTLLAAPFIDAPSKGRRFLLNISFPIMGLSMLVAGLILLGPSRESDSRASNAVIAVHYLALFTFTIAYSIGEGPAAFVISSEMFQTVNRELGMSFAVFLNFTGAGLLALLVPALTKYMGQPYVLVGCFGTNMLAWLACFLLVPDTVNKELEDIAARFDIPTRTTTIYHFAWLWDRLRTLFRSRHNLDLDILDDWCDAQTLRWQGKIPWRIIFERPEAGSVGN